jgi:hypothetical protein
VCSVYVVCARLALFQASAHKLASRDSLPKELRLSSCLEKARLPRFMLLLSRFRVSRSSITCAKKPRCYEHLESALAQLRHFPLRRGNLRLAPTGAKLNATTTAEAAPLLTRRLSSLMPGSTKKALRGLQGHGAAPAQKHPCRPNYRRITQEIPPPRNSFTRWGPTPSSSCSQKIASGCYSTIVVVTSTSIPS